LAIFRLCDDDDYGVKSLIHQSELRTHTKVVRLKEKKFLSFCCIVKNTERNEIINIDPGDDIADKWLIWR
jgi:hypothetical protein